MREEEVRQCERQLQSTVPVLGTALQRKACRRLAEDAGPETVPVLCAAMNHPDATVRDTARRAIHSLKNPDSVDALCALWWKTRDPALEEVVAGGQVARRPLEVRLASALRAGLGGWVVEGEQAVRILAGFLDSPDAAWARQARTMFMSLTSPVAVDALCGVWAETRDPRLGEYIARSNYIARKPLPVRVLSALLAKAPDACVTDEAGVAALLDILRGDDPEMAARAREAVAALRQPAAVDALCAVWAETRDPELGAVLRARSMTARAPLELRVLTAVWAGRTDGLAATPEDARVLACLLDDPDPDVRAGAEKALGRPARQEAADALCALWARTEDPRLGGIIAGARIVASAPPLLRVRSAFQAGREREILDEPEAAGILITIAGGADAEEARRAAGCLRLLQAQEAVNLLCRRWAETRHPVLGELMEQGNFVADAPPELHFLSALKTGVSTRLAEMPGGVELLAGALSDPDPVVARRADTLLSSLERPENRDALCALAVEDPSGAAAALCLREGYRPADPEDCCLYLFVTRQFDAYFAEDYEFQNLRQAYDRAAEPVRALVRALVNSGDLRCMGFFGARKRLPDCTDQEIRIALDSAVRHGDWPRIFQALLELPLDFTLPLMGGLAESGWRPADPDRAALFDRITRDTGGAGADASGGPLAAWLADGAGPELAAVPAEELLRRLHEADPPEAVRLAAALAARGAEGAADAVAAHPHWLVRLAGYVAGLTPLDPGAPPPHEPVLFSRMLLGARHLMEFWPAHATPADLDILRRAPAEARLGAAGRVRRILEALLTFRITAGSFDLVLIKDGEFAPPRGAKGETAP
ncbi:MAG: hypothetical protein GXY15_02265 [Candidatus Hydrogenedentes bacterium]|nr:hypothetical protein [Candidatus Hydrogenedentota bacterium]